MKATTLELWIAYRQLKSTVKVAQRFGTCHSNVVQRLKNAGYELGRPGRRAKSGAGPYRDWENRNG